MFLPNFLHFFVKFKFSLNDLIKFVNNDIYQSCFGVLALVRENVPIGQGRPFTRLGLAVVDGGRDSVEADEATAEDGVESEDGETAVVPDADLEPPMSKIGLVKTVLEGFLKDRSGRLPLGFCFSFCMR